MWVAAMSPETFAQAAERDIQIITTGPGRDPDRFRAGLESAAEQLHARGRPRDATEFPMAIDTHAATSSRGV